MRRLFPVKPRNPIFSNGSTPSTEIGRFELLSYQLDTDVLAEHIHAFTGICYPRRANIAYRSGGLMFPQLSKSATAPKSFLWTFPECPVRIHVNFDFIERLRQEVLDAASADREMGGLLIGKELSPDGEVEISSYIRLPAGSELIKNFSVCSNSLTKAIQSGRPADQQVVGFYRTHLEPRIELRTEDRECIRAKFNDPNNVFLIIRPHDGRASAGFFFWQDTSVVGGLTFPFSSAELNSPSWTTLVGGTPRPSGLDNMLTRTRETARGISTGMKIGLVVIAAIAIAAAGTWRLYNSPVSTVPAQTSVPPSATSQSGSTAQSGGTSPALGLRVEKALMGVVVAWNPDAREIATSKDANLLIWDGSNPPAFIRLNSTQLHAGRAFFTAVNDRVEVRMDIIGPGGSARSESIVSVARPPEILTPESSAAGAGAAPPMPKPILPQALRKSEDIPHPQVASQGQPPPSQGQAAKEARPAPRVFTPLASSPKVNSASTDLPQPPQMEAANLTALTQTFHTFNDPQAAPAPRAVEVPRVVREVPTTPAAVPDIRPKPAAPPAATAPVVVSSYQAATPIRELRPQLPAQLKTLVQSENVVEVEVHISDSGKVTSAKTGNVKGPSAGFLSKIALNAARGWEFRPAIQNGKAVESDKILEFVFRPAGR